MVREYFRIAWRNMIRNKAYSMMNIGGLSTGIAVSLLIGLYVVHEYSYDRFHKNADRIYRVYAKLKFAESTDSVDYPLMSFQTGPAMKRSDPAVESFVRLQATSYEEVRVQNPTDPGKTFFERPFLFADSNFFDFFSFRLKEGDAGQVLAKPFTVVITRAAAKKYFGNEDPVGRYLTYDSAYTFEITGIAEDAPSNSTIRYEFIASLSSSESMGGRNNMRREPEVMLGEYSTYVRLKKGVPVRRSEAVLERLTAQNTNYNTESARYLLLRMAATHLFFNGSDRSNTKYLNLFVLAGALILILALINYMSLATARATLRAKEVGVRKVIGASRPALARQFYTESALYSLIAFIFGLLLFRLAQPYFFNRLRLPIDASFLYQPKMLAIIGGLLVMTILVAGSYPSIILSSFSPVAVLYGKLSRRKGGAGIRKLFIILQFSISAAMIICTLIVGRQMYFFRHTDTGLNRENVLMIPFKKSIGAHYPAFRNDVLRLSEVDGIATAHYPMYGGYDILGVSSKMNKTPRPMVLLNVDERFIPLLEIKWKRPPTDNSAIANHGIIINEAAIDQLNLPSDPLGESVAIGDDKLTIAGVVKNFNYRSLHDKTEALALSIVKDSSLSWGSGFTGCLFIKLRPKADIPALIRILGKLYIHYDPSTNFSYEFLDDAFDAQYKAEDRLSGLTEIFAGLTILIACLGLVGLVAFSATERTREIGIRKVLGGSVRRIVFMLTKDFVRYVVIAALIAIPISLYYMNRWLNNFAYRVSIGWGVCALTLLLTTGIAILIIGLIGFKAAMANPVENLRTD